MVSKTQARNTTQRISEILRGSRLTVWGSGGFTESQVGDGIVTTYSPPAGKKARIKGTLSVTSLGTNTRLGIGIFDSVTTFIDEIQTLNAVGSTYFEVLIGPNQNLIFTGDNVANDGTGGCAISIEELPA